MHFCMLERGGFPLSFDAMRTSTKAPVPNRSQHSPTCRYDIDSVSECKSFFYRVSAFTIFEMTSSETFAERRCAFSNASLNSSGFFACAVALPEFTASIMRMSATVSSEISSWIRMVYRLSVVLSPSGHFSVVELFLRVEEVFTNPCRRFVSESVQILDDADGIGHDDVEHHRPRERASLANRLIERYGDPKEYAIDQEFRRPLEELA